jgi:hypothetical protein
VRCGIVFTCESAYALHERMPPAVCVIPEALVTPSGERLLSPVERRGVVMWQWVNRAGWRGPGPQERSGSSTGSDGTGPDA